MLLADNLTADLLVFSLSFKSNSNKTSICPCESFVSSVVIQAGTFIYETNGLVKTG